MIGQVFMPAPTPELSPLGFLLSSHLIEGEWAAVLPDPDSTQALLG